MGRAARRPGGVAVPTRRDAGPDAVGTYFGSLSGWDPAGRAVGETFHRRLGSRSRYTSTTTDCPSKPLVAQAVLGHAAITPLPDLERTAMLLLIGTNPVVSHGHTWALPDPVVALREVQDRGGEVWVVDPRTTETARLATAHLARRAGTDHAVLGHLLRELLDRGADDAYLEPTRQGPPSSPSPCSATTPTTPPPSPASGATISPDWSPLSAGRVACRSSRARA